MACRPGKLLRFSIHEGGIQLKDGEPQHVDLCFEGIANQRRGRVDLWTKVLLAFHPPQSRMCLKPFRKFSYKNLVFPQVKMLAFFCRQAALSKAWMSMFQSLVESRNFDMLAHAPDWSGLLCRSYFSTWREPGQSFYKTFCLQTRTAPSWRVSQSCWGWLTSRNMQVSCLQIISCVPLPRHCCH